MNNQIWSFILTAVGLAGFFLAGRKVWWCWYVNIFNQVLWATYAFVTSQWGFLIGTGFYSAVFVNNAISWTKVHRLKKDWVKKHGHSSPIGNITEVSWGPDGLTAVGKLNDEGMELFQKGHQHEWEYKDAWAPEVGTYAWLSCRHCSAEKDLDDED